MNQSIASRRELIVAIITLLVVAVLTILFLPLVSAPAPSAPTAAPAVRVMPAQGAWAFGIEAARAPAGSWLRAG